MEGKKIKSEDGMLRNAAKKLGFNRTIAYTVLNKFLQAAINLFIIFSISRCLTQAEQGYYYTFNSIAALQVFFELGLSTVLMQFVAHEFAFLKFSDTGKEVSGDNLHKSRIASLLKLSFKWYLVSAILMLAIITPVGFLFFGQKNESDDQLVWEAPWVIVMIATSINLLCSPYFSILEGMGKLLEVARFRINQMLLSYAVLLLTLNLGMGLYSLAFFVLSGAIASAYFLIGNYKNRRVLSDLWNSFSGNHKISWRKEIFPFQWKIGLSWLSGYFIFQILNPLLFAFQGPVVAGQIGITLAVFGGLSAVSMAWINTKAPTLSMLIAKREYNALDNIFFKTLKQLIIVAALTTGVGWLAMFCLHLYLPQYGSRFVDPIPMAFIAANSLLNQLIFALAIYLRCHKKEPYLLPSIAGAFSTASIAYISARWLGVYELTLSLLAVGLIVFLPWNIQIFRSKRLDWHS